MRITGIRIATALGVAVMATTIAVPQASMAQPGAEFQDQGMREDLGHPAMGEPFRLRHAYVAPQAYGYVFVPGRAPVHHFKVTPHRRHY